MESLSVKGAIRDALLHRLLPFATVIALLATSTLIAIFANGWLGGAGALATLASVVAIYLRGGKGELEPDQRSDAPPPETAPDASRHDRSDVTPD